MLDAGVSWLDGVLYTHEHADHTHGIDDLRQVAYNGQRRVDVYYNAETGRLLQKRFDYCFAQPAGSEYPPILKGHEIAPGVPVRIEGAGGAIEALPVPAAPRARRDARLPLRRTRLFAGCQRPA